VWFTSPSTGYAAGNPSGNAGIAAVYKSIDSGTTWTLQATSKGNGNTLFAIRFVSANTGYAAGAFGNLLTTTDAGANWIAEDASNYNDGFYDFSAITFAGPSIGFMTDAGGGVYRTSNSGGLVVALRPATSPDGVIVTEKNDVLEYSLPRAGNVSIALYDAHGRRLKTLFEGSQEAGAHALTLPSAKLSAGRYLVEVRAGAMSRSVSFTK
jgi:photosystem II stability/assembly factor-like uncharacterized protein